MLISSKKIYGDIFSKYPKYNSENRPVFQKFIDKRKEYKCNNILDLGTGRGKLQELEIDQFNDVSYISSDLYIFYSQKAEKIIKNFYQCDFNNSGNLYSTILAIRQIYPGIQMCSCLDLLEHLYPVAVENFLKQISDISMFYYFSVANHSDIISGHELHLIQEEFEFWKNLIGKYYRILESKEESNLYTFVCGRLK